MEPDVPRDRPESPKKKIKASSSVDSDVMSTDHLDRQNTKSIQNVVNENIREVNGLAPTRSGRKLAADSTSESVTVSSINNESQSIQEDVVSSSENMTSSTRMVDVECEGNADSRSKKLDQTLSHDVEEQNDE